MRYSNILMSIVPLLALAACDDSGITGPRSGEPTAKVRFVNAAIDAGVVDFRFVDRVENLPTLQGVAFRASSGGYQGAGAGTRLARVFPYSNDPAVTQTMLVDTTLNLAANARYTMVFAGQTTGNQDRLVALEDPAELPSPAAGQIAIKVLHAVVGTAAVDVYVVPVDSATAPTPADWQTAAVTVVNNVPYLSQTAYVNVPVRPTTGLRLYRFVVTAAGSATPLFATTPNLPGTPAPTGANYGPLPGVQISGSVLTAVLAAGSVPGSPGSVTANQTPSAILLIDKPLNP